MLDVHLCQSLIRQGLLVAVMVTYAVMLRWVDVVLLGQLRPLGDVAVYGNATKIIDVVSIISISASAALFPVLSIRWRESVDATRSVYAQLLRFFIAFGLATAVGLTLSADSIVTMIFGMPYLVAAHPLRILAWAFFFQVITAPMSMLLVVAGDRLKKIMPVLGGVLLGNIVLNLLLAPRLGYMGAALAFVVTTFALLIVNEWAATIYFDHAPRVTQMMMRPLLAGLAMGLVSWTLRPLSMFVSILLGGLVFIVTLALLGEWKEEPYKSLLASVIPPSLFRRLGCGAETPSTSPSDVGVP
jgi:O-antigen/teichoic acid export membrane protein